MTDKPTYATDAATLSESTDRLEAEGFTGQFAPVEDGAVMCFTCRERPVASEVVLDALRRTEGASDPDDMVVIAAVTCPKCGTKGTLVLKYGADATPEESDVLLQLEDRRKTLSGGQSPSPTGAAEDA